MLHTLMVGVTLLVPGFALGAEGWRAGSARVAITPKQPMWMAGYGSRNKPSEGAIHDLWAKALVLEDQGGQCSALVTLDLCGIGREISLKIRDGIKANTKIERDRVVLACSHTHSGPAIADNLVGMYPLDEVQQKRVEAYADFLVDAVVNTTVKAAEQLKAAEVDWGVGRAGFAVNRRTNKEPEVPALREKLALQGPVDHDVPVLRVTSVESKTPMAIVCGYACHCTVLSGYQFCGDYAGFAQIAIERDHPGAQAMFVAGCGADQNPLPRRTVEIATDYGQQLAEGVRRVVESKMTPAQGSLKAAYKEIDLAFGTLPDRKQLETDAQSETLAVRNRAKRLLQTLDKTGSIPSTYPYPVQVWRLGELTWVFLGGEVVVDYSLRIKRNLGSSRTWVSAYSNDVCAYIPSLRVLQEGGYEGGGAMVYYGLPAPWSDQVENQIIQAVSELAGTVAKGR